MSKNLLQCRSCFHLANGSQSPELDDGRVCPYCRVPMVRLGGTFQGPKVRVPLVYHPARRSRGRLISHGNAKISGEGGTITIRGLDTYGPIEITSTGGTIDLGEVSLLNTDSPVVLIKGATLNIHNVKHRVPQKKHPNSE
jgi:hypothetical protein